MNDMVPRPRNGLSLCSGAGGLDMGLMLAEPGFHTRCYVEWEEYPRQSLIAGQRAGYLAPAPIWDDVTTFDARPLAGAIDTLIAGYPCQGESLAGKRKGIEDERWLWDDVERIIRELGPTLRWCFFENVRGHVSSGLETVLRALRNMGFAVGSGIFSAEEVGATHERQRVFIVAYRQSSDRRGEQPERSPRRGRTGSAGDRAELDHATSPRRDDAGQRAGSDQQSGECLSGAGCDQLADPSQSGPQGREQPGPPDQRDGSAASGSASQFRRAFLFPPGPSDLAAWSEILASSPDLAPALSVGDVKRACDHFAAMVEAGHMAQAEAESRLRGMAHELAQRPRILRLLGNGVAPLQAAYAWRSLSAAHGLRPLDLGTADDHAPGTDAGELV